MRQERSTDDLISAWTLVEADRALVGNKTGATRPAFAALVKFFFTGYRWVGRTIEYHRAQVRQAFGFREFTRGDEARFCQRTTSRLDEPTTTCRLGTACRSFDTLNTPTDVSEEPE